jgi:hypothetical protein
MDVVLHVGMFKAASTTLQRAVFPRLPDLAAVGRKQPGEADSPLSLAMAQIGHDVYRAGALRECLERQAGDRPLLVSEELWTSPVMHRRWERMVRTADRLARELPRATALIVVRRPADLLVSSYTQYVRMGGTTSWRRFVARCDLRTYDVDAIARLYVERFPTVNVLMFEDLKQPARFASRLVEALGSEADPAAVADWLRSPDNVGFDPLLGYAHLAANRAIRISVWNPTPPLPLLNPLYHRLVSPGLDRARRRLDARGWRANRWIAARRRELADRETGAFRYPVAV